MPVTFVAHQVPVLPIARRWPHRFDPIALVVGSMAPDFSFAFHDLPVDIPAHRFPIMFVWGVPATIVVSWMIVTVLAPVVPDHLPELGPLRLRDYRGIAAHRFRGVPLVAGAIVGIITHVVLDTFTHEWGWPAQHIEWYRSPIFGWDLRGIEVSPYRLLQYAGHVGLTIWGVRMLAERGRHRWLAATAARVDRPLVTLGSHVLLWCPALLGATAMLCYSVADDASNARLVISTAAGAFAGLLVGSIAVRRRCASQ